MVLYEVPGEVDETLRALSQQSAFGDEDTPGRVLSDGVALLNRITGISRSGWSLVREARAAMTAYDCNPDNEECRKRWREAASMLTRAVLEVV